MAHRHKLKTLRPVHPNAGIEAAYRKRLKKLVEEMHRSTEYWLLATYRRHEDRIAQDESPADALRRSMKDLAKRWNSKFDEMAKKLASYFAQSIESRSSAVLKKILKDGGFAIDFQMTKAMKDVLEAAVAENVALIKSIPQQYLGRVETIVMQGAQVGRDIAHIKKELSHGFGITQRRAAFIARDQTEKMTAAFVRARHLEVGITEAVWVHPGAGKHPRPTHVKAGKDKIKYSVKDGWLDPAINKRIWPGTEINCRCVSKPVVPGFS